MTTQQEMQDGHSIRYRGRTIIFGTVGYMNTNGHKDMFHVSYILDDSFSSGAMMTARGALMAAQNRIDHLIKGEH